MRPYSLMFSAMLLVALVILGGCRPGCIAGNCSANERRQITKSEPFRAAACPTLDLIPRSVACGRQRGSRDHLKCMQALDRRGYTC